MDYLAIMPDQLVYLYLLTDNISSRKNYFKRKRVAQNSPRHHLADVQRSKLGTLTEVQMLYKMLKCGNCFGNRPRFQVPHLIALAETFSQH